VNDILEVVKKGSVEKLTEFLNELDDSNNIKFTYEVEQPLLTITVTISRSAVKQDKKNGGLKLQIYRKPTHTDQYLNFSSHHPTEHKLSVVRILLERSQCLITEIEDRKREDSHVEEDFRACGYPKWTFDKVRRQIESKRHKKTRQQCDSSQLPMVVTPYVENISEAVARKTRKHNVPVAMKPHKTLKSVLVPPKDKQEKEDLTECVYKVPCANRGRKRK